MPHYQEVPGAEGKAHVLAVRCNDEAISIILRDMGLSWNRGWRATSGLATDWTKPVKG